MKRILCILTLILMLCPVAAFADTSETVTIPADMLTTDQKARLAEQDISNKLETYSKWAGMGKEIGTAVDSSLGALTTGRKMGRKEAMRQFATQAVVEDLKACGVTIGKANMEDIADESRFAYKDIDTVIANEKDLVEPIKKLKTVCVIKG